MFAFCTVNFNFFRDCLKISGYSIIYCRKNNLRYLQGKSTRDARHAQQMGGLMTTDCTTHRFVAEVLDSAVEIGGLAQKRGHVLAVRLVEMRQQPGCGAHFQCIRRFLVFACVSLQRVGCNKRQEHRSSVW